MADYYKTARRWQREHRSSGASDLTFARDKSSGEFKLPPKRPSGVPPTGSKGPGGSVPARSPSHYEKVWKDLDTGSRPGPRWRGIGTGVLGFLGSIADDAKNWDRGDWDRFMDDGTLPDGLDFLNPSPDAYERFAEKNGIPVPGSAGSAEWAKANPDFVDNLGRQIGIYWETQLGTPSCDDVPGWYPGELFPGFIVDYFANGHMGSGFCQSVGGLPQPGWGGVQLGHWGLWSTESKNGQPQGNGRLFKAWVRLEGWPTTSPEVRQAAPGETLPSTVTVGGGAPKYTFMPGVRMSGYTAPDPNVSVPMRHAPALKAALQILGERFDSGYNPEKQAWEENPGEVIAVDVTPNRPPPKWPPPVTTKPSEPYKPPGSKNDRKTFVRGRALFQAAQRGFHGLTEYGDFIESFYDALPRKYQTCKIGGPACQTAKVLAHWDEVDIPTAVINWLWNDFEDRVLGRGFGKLDKAARRLGTRDYKLLNSANGSPLDEGLGSLYGEFVQEHVNPTKEQFVSWAKENLL